MNHFENEDYTDNQWPYRLGRIVYDNLVLMNFADHPARAQRISAILEAMPEIDIQAPYNHQKDIQRIVDSLVPILCRMHGKDEPREFMARFEAVMDIWDDIPHTTKSGKSLPVSQRRLGYRVHLTRKHTLAVFTRTQYKYGKRDPRDGPWQNDLNIIRHLGIKGECIERSLDPRNPERREALEEQRRLRVEQHVDHEIVALEGIDFTTSPLEAISCPCLQGV